MPATIRVLFLLFSFLITINSSAQRLKIKEYYPEGKLKMKGILLDSLKHGDWFYYRTSGKLEKHERWKRGKIVFTVFYNERNKRTEYIDSKGVRKKYKGCGC